MWYLPAAPFRVRPAASVEKAWHNCIDYTEELLQTWVTWANTLELPIFPIPSELDLILVSMMNHSTGV